MLQTIMQIVFTTVILAACVMLAYINNTKFHGTLMSQDLCCFLVSTPALNAFLMFVVQAVLVVIVEACFFRHISNTIIISLDIIYFISMLLLVLYNSLKESPNHLVKVA